MLLVTLAEGTPVHEAAALQADLRRAQIEPFAWAIHQSFAAIETHAPLLTVRAHAEVQFIREVIERFSKRTALVPWTADEPVGTEGLQQLFQVEADSRIP